MAHMIAETPSLQDLITENTQHKMVIEQLRKEMAHLQEQLAWLKKQLFGQRSEKFVDGVNENQPFLPGFELPKNAKRRKKRQSLRMSVANLSAMEKIKSPYLLTFL